MPPQKIQIYQSLIEPSDSSVLFVDFQEAMLARLPSTEQLKIRTNISLLAKCVSELGLPMFFFRYALPDKAGALIEELKTVAESAVVFTRDQQDIWQDSVFSDQLRKSGRKTLIVAGLTTDLFLISPSILAVRRGYRTYAVIDASASWSQEALIISSLRLLQAGVTPISIASVIAELRFGKGGPASKELEYLFAVHDAMFGMMGMTGNISAAMRASLPSKIGHR